MDFSKSHPSTWQSWSAPTLHTEVTTGVTVTGNSKELTKMPSKERLTLSFFASLAAALLMLLEEFSEAMGLAWVHNWDDYHIWAIIVMLCLLGSIMALGVELLRMGHHVTKLEGNASRASEAFEELLVGYFDKWSFTRAERDVARLLLKGCSTAEIAEARDAKEGTVKAQTNSIYRKSGFSNKSQLFSALLEDLTGDGSKQN
ncbi:helix-turn-helix transcriptional regulator [Ruegeria arenilitoris]|uniref:helix-turn-helix transcriptional regulator n=1 Tax=Ruegeria arenilitoris TaxID=1173585 RepID=UPI0020C3F08C|nr:helix-turn-helix transcriptional regulator [Ruegeria arenilitoris]